MADEDDYLAPMLATLTRDRFPAEGWVFERKLDGVRAIATRRNGATRLWSRNRKPMDASYPEVVEALDDLPGADLVADGEVVAFDGDSTSFARLQRRIHQTNPRLIRASGVEVFYYVFDLLAFDGHDMRRLPLSDRQTVLREVFEPADPLRLSQPRVGDGRTLFAEACVRGWEGLIAKRAGSPYTPGRSPDWLKLKCVRDQELVVGGWTEPSGSRSGLGALLVGYHDEAGGLRYAGKVGTGFDEADLRRLRDLLGPLEQQTSPFVDQVRDKRAHWVTPEVVAQIAFAEWTTAGRLRHPAYQGLRTDKDPALVVREQR
ncbi:MAG: non-homologous end-joining DNA ligase [Mycobacteriales bacterium]